MHGAERRESLYLPESELETEVQDFVDGLQKAPEPGLSLPARVFLCAVAVVGLGILLAGLLSLRSQDPARLFTYLVLAVLASGLRLSLPTVSGSLSLNFFFILIGLTELTVPETLLLGCLTTLVGMLWRPVEKPKRSQVVFQLAITSIAIWTADVVFHNQYAKDRWIDATVSQILAVVTFYLMNTVPVALMAAEHDRVSFGKIWRERYFWALPYYMAGGLAASTIALANRVVGWRTSLFVFPAVYLVYRSYYLYLGRLADEKLHAEDMASLHLRTIEALALAIEAKDNTTGSHLERVQIYAMELGRELGLNRDEMEALRAASLLHDIGKLAVPEHIISKPGRLTPEEFEKMKIHPVVGAEILERVQFPYPVVPIVIAHHEKWDGSGYPAGLKGEQIPIGARILSAVDTLDALASDRQYRKALPLDDAMRRVVAESGKAFDPKVVKLLAKRYVELERKAHSVQVEKHKLSVDLKIEAGAAPAAGFVSENGNGDAATATVARTVDFLNLIAAARQEVQGLFELASDIGNSLSLNETLSVLAVRLQRMIPYNAMAIYCTKGDRLIPEYVTGDNFRLLASLQIPVGAGLSGWVAENRKPLINGNPTVEPGYLDQPGSFSALRSALAVPLEGVNGVVGVLTLYHEQRDAFTRDHLRILLAVSPKIALSVENALRFRQAEDCATTDFVTGLPNARSLFLHLDAELARSKRTDSPLSIVVCDLNGFKQINDRFGHLEGDRVLKIVGDSLKLCLREYDCVARMGGDEFVVVMPGLKAELIKPTMERLSETAESSVNRMFGEKLITLSLGSAYYPTDGEDAETLLAEADRRMYKFKQENRELARR